MTELQLLTQLRHLLKTRTWTDAAGSALGTGAKVFGDNVVITAGARNEDVLESLSLPCAVIIPGSSQHSPQAGEDPRSLTTSPRVRIIAAVQGDRVGQAVLVGHGVDDEGQSSGQGLLQIQEQVFGAIEELGSAEGVFIRLRATSEAVAVDLEEAGMVNIRDIEFEARVSTERFYPPVSSLTLTGGSGQIALTWVLPAIRYDFVKVKVRRGPVKLNLADALEAAPSTHSTGTEVATPAQATSVTDAGLPAGFYGYSLFILYDDRSLTPTNETFPSEAFSASAEVT